MGVKHQIQDKNLRKEKMVRNEGESLKRVVVCTPKHEYTSASNLEKHNIGELGNPKVTIQQHDTLKSKLREFGAEVITVNSQIKVGRNFSKN